MRRFLPALLVVGLAPAAMAATGQNFGTHLTGAEEVPVRETLAQGQATFQLSEDETELAYKVNVANIHNVVASHIHLAPAGVNGGVVAFLAGNFPAGGGPSNGVLAQGTITAG
ncbi:MAG TPA: CHRD domain-containing protein, partial [Actinomycetota bacterium]